MKRRIFAVITTYRRTALLLAFMSSAALGMFAPRDLDHSTEAFFLSDDPELITYNRLVDEFGSDELITVALELGDVFSSESLRDIQQLTRALDGVQHTDA